MKKIFNCILFAFYLLITCISFANAVQVVEYNPNTQSEQVAWNESEGFRAVVLFVFGGGLLLVICGLIIFGFFLIMQKIWKKLTEIRGRKRDFIFDLFVNDSQQCHTNRDPVLKKRNWKTLFIFYKRLPVFAKTEHGLELLGGYDGECDKKEGFKQVAIYNKLGIFKFITQVIILPNHIKHKYEKVNLDGKKYAIIECEGLDNIINRDFYLMPLIQDPKQDKNYLDFSDLVYDKYIEKNALKDTITENLLSYKDGIQKSVETNPYIQLGRRKQKE